MEQTYIMNTYARFPITFVAGKGCRLKDSTGREYLDCLAGIAVVSAGHSNPKVAAAIAQQAGTLGHVSNLFWNEPGLRLAAKLRQLTGGWGTVFFGNSGAEANECAIKLVRKWAGPGRFKIICAEGSFHGRTLGALAATGQPAKWAGFEPLPAGFVHVRYNDLQAFAGAIDAATGGIWVEPILGENGVIPADAKFLEGLRELCDRHKLALMFDEVQCGMGRTGSWWAFQQYGVTPDLFTCAKALANGFPIGACVAQDELAGAFTPGAHASTFGGNPLACAAALATIDYFEEAGLLAAAQERGRELTAILAKLPHVKEVRGRGLLLGAVLTAPKASAVATAALKEGLVINSVRDDVLRFAPPLVITKGEIREAGEKLAAAIRQVFL